MNTETFIAASIGIGLVNTLGFVQGPGAFAELIFIAAGFGPCDDDSGETLDTYASIVFATAGFDTFAN